MLPLPGNLYFLFITCHLLKIFCNVLDKVLHSEFLKELSENDKEVLQKHESEFTGVVSHFKPIKKYILKRWCLVDKAHCV